MSQLLLSPIDWSSVGICDWQAEHLSLVIQDRSVFNITKPDLVQLLEAAAMNQLFQFDEKLYEKIDGGVAMGSPLLGPLMASAILYSVEEK